MNNMNNKKKMIIIFVCAFILRLVFAFLVWHPDVNNHVDWGVRFFDYGPQEFYQANVWSFTWPNQPPGTMYMFAGIKVLSGWVYSFLWTINLKVPLFPSKVMFFVDKALYPALLQFPGIIADFGIAYLIYKIIGRYIIKGKKARKMALLGSALFLFNPAVWYNSSVWGQYDSVINFFVLLAFYFLFQKKLVRAVLALFLSIYIKASLLIFVPVFLVVALKQKYKVKKYILSVAFSLLLISIVTYPFSRGEPFGWLYYLYKDKIFKNQLQVITANAFNIWAGLTGINEQPHTLTLGPLTYQVWGIILYVTSYIPVLYLVIKDKRPTNVFWALAIVAFSSFSLLTNMHERYLYPIFPVFSIIAVANPGLLPVYAFISVLNLINMYHIWWYPRVEFVVEAFSAYDKLLPRILGFVGFGLFVYLYLRFLRHLRNA